jgi:hypothetical protein
LRYHSLTKQYRSAHIPYSIGDEILVGNPTIHGLMRRWIQPKFFCLGRGIHPIMINSTVDFETSAWLKKKRWQLRLKKGDNSEGMHIKQSHLLGGPVRFAKIFA